MTTPNCWTRPSLRTLPPILVLGLFALGATPASSHGVGYPWEGFVLIHGFPPAPPTVTWTADLTCTWAFTAPGTNVVECFPTTPTPLGPPLGPLLPKRCIAPGLVSEAFGVQIGSLHSEMWCGDHASVICDQPINSICEGSALTIAAEPPPLRCLTATTGFVTEYRVGCDTLCGVFSQGQPLCEFPV